MKLVAIQQKVICLHMFDFVCSLDYNQTSTQDRSRLMLGRLWYLLITDIIKSTH